MFMKNDPKTVLVIGTGTIGEPLIGLFSRLKKKLKIDEVIFHKRTPLEYERPKVNSLVNAGAKLAVDTEAFDDFKSLGHTPDYTYEQALEKANVIVDCTPAGNVNKNEFYQKYNAGNEKKFFIAQGSEKGFGFPYALGVNDEVLETYPGNFAQVVSCNTHTISRLLKCLSADNLDQIDFGDFVCLRRANDISQDTGFVSSIVCGKHNDENFGTHHARDVDDLFNRAKPMPIFSSALKLNTQYMHAVRFNIVLDGLHTRKQILDRLTNDSLVATTSRKSSNTVFSFGRDHGFYGRIYSQAVVSLPALSVNTLGDKTRVVGCAFTPQDGNSLLSSVAATLFGLHGDDYKNYLTSLLEFVNDEV